MKNKCKLKLLSAIFLSLFLSTNANCSELLVLEKPRVKSQRLNKVLKERNVSFLKTFQTSEGLLKVVEVSSSEDQEKILESLKRTGLFKFVEPNYKLISDYAVISNPKKEIIPNDKDFNKQYYLDKTNVPGAWLYSIGSLSPIAVLDSGIDYLRLDINGRVLPCEIVLNENFSCQDIFGHGTKVSSIIGSVSDNELGLAGISWLNPILPVKVSNIEGIATVSSVIEGLLRSANNGAKIVVISLSTNKKSEALRIAIKQAVNKGILIVSSGGNTGLEEIRYPAGYDDVIGVGSVGENEKRSFFSNAGNHIKLVAPGERIVTVFPGSNLVQEVYGTSFSAPQVAGIASLVWAKKPELTGREIAKILYSTAKDLGKEGFDSEYGYGLVDALGAVKD